MKILGKEDHILDLVNQPAFTVHGGKIRHVNQAARSLLIKENTPILELIPHNKDTYVQFTGGCLYMTLRIFNIDCGASVTKSGKYHIFVLDDLNGSDQLQALALTGNMLKMPLANMTALLETHYTPETLEDPQASRNAALLHKNAAQLYRIITNMCDAADWLKNEFEKELCDVTVLFTEIMECCKDALAHANIKLLYTCPEAHLISMVDTEKFTRSLYNLVSNAVRYASGKPQVKAELTYDREFFYVSIQNPCIQYDQEQFTTAFTHYLRRPSLDNGRNGVGLGMYLIRSAALAHDGTVLINQPDPCTMCVTMSMKIQDPDNITILRSPIRRLSNYAGGKNIALIEFSDFLPETCYKKES